MKRRRDDPMATAQTAARHKVDDSSPWDDKTDALYGETYGIGAVIGDYVVDEVRYRGGFATVYRARHQDNGREVALKVLHRDLVSSSEMVKRFEQEAATIRRLGHPGIVEILGFGEIGVGQPYIVMEWLEGRNLEEELKARGPFSPDEALAIVSELAEALAAVHELEVVHRDLKAQNVVCLPQEGWFKLKLVDFGVAKLIDPKTRSELTSSGKIVGTPLNMAPEQILGQPVDARTDVYALGLILYQLVTGQLPFRGATAVEVEEMHLQAPPPRPSDLAPVGRAFDAVVARALRKDKSQRYPGVRELVADLRVAIREGTPTIAAARSMAIQVRVQLDPSIEDPDDETLDDLDAALALARQALGRAGLTTALEASGIFVATTLLPGGSAERDARATALRTAVDLDRKIAARDPRAEGVNVAVTVHAASDRDKHELLRLGDWTPTAQLHGVVATAAALEGIEDRFESQALDYTTPVPARRIKTAR